jgi:hypothetical protein
MIDLSAQKSILILKPATSKSSKSISSQAIKVKKKIKKRQLSPYQIKE